MAEEKKISWLPILLKLAKARGLLAILMILLAGFSAVWSFKHPQVKVESQTVYYPVPGNTQVIIKEKIVPVDHIVIIEKPGVPNLPDDVAKDTNQQVTAVGTVPSWEGNTSIAALINLGSGKTTLYQKREPLSFFAFENKAWLIGGVGLKETSAAVEWEYARISKARLSIYAEINTRGDYEVQARVKIPIW
jgi:hypothetical protein